MLHLRCVAVLTLLLNSCAIAHAQAPTAAASLSPSTLPVREVTVFKDGHAYVVREAPLPEAASGRVVLDELPTPVLGTFWPYASGGARLVQAKAGREQVSKDVDALERIAERGRGALVYLMQEGRGAGLAAKARDRMLCQASGSRLTTFDAYAEMGLPPDLRQAITLREIEGLSYEEIADVMNCPIGTVRSRIFRAREAIANRLRPLLGTREGERW